MLELKGHGKWYFTDEDGEHFMGEGEIVLIQPAYGENRDVNFELGSVTAKFKKDQIEEVATAKVEEFAERAKEILYCNGCQLEPSKCFEHPKHIIDCDKVKHDDGLAYGHHAENDQPFTDDTGKWFCGKCHNLI